MPALSSHNSRDRRVLDGQEMRPNVCRCLGGGGEDRGVVRRKEIWDRSGFEKEVDSGQLLNLLHIRTRAQHSIFRYTAKVYGG